MSFVWYDECPKCGECMEKKGPMFRSECVGVRGEPFTVSGKMPDPVIEEWLQYECGLCGYQPKEWRKPCLDAPKESVDA